MKPLTIGELKAFIGKEELSDDIELCVEFKAIKPVMDIGILRSSTGGIINPKKLIFDTRKYVGTTFIEKENK